VELQHPWYRLASADVRSHLHASASIADDRGTTGSTGGVSNADGSVSFSIDRGTSSAPLGRYHRLSLLEPATVRSHNFSFNSFAYGISQAP
jgi:hypothetical protein